MAEFLEIWKNGPMNFLKPPSSKFWVLNPNLKSFLHYFQIFSHFQPFLAKMAEFLGGCENGALSLLRPPLSIFWVLNPNLKSFLQYFQNFSRFQPFLAIFWAKNGWFFGNLKKRSINLLRPPSSNFWVLNPNLKSVLQYFENFSHF